MKNKSISDIIDIVLDVLLVGLTIAAVIFSLTMVHEINDYSVNYASNEDRLTDTVRYSMDRLVELVSKNEALNVKPKGDMEELYALAHYYDNALRAHAFETAGYPEEAKKYRDVLDEYREKCGGYAFWENEIDSMFE